ncbi:MAG: hypothetical protein IJW70_00970 [Clostridia bacterium]|nr:hypothetical protein [Clostridia bacterium]
MKKSRRFGRVSLAEENSVTSVSSDIAKENRTHADAEIDRVSSALFGYDVLAVCARPLYSATGFFKAQKP